MNVISRAISVWQARLFDWLGDRNPQLLRELKGRLRQVPILAVVGLSLLIQSIIMINFASALPGTIADEDLTITTYPYIVWGKLSQLDTEVQEEILSVDNFLGRRYANHLEKSAVFVADADLIEPVWGDRMAGLAVMNQIQPGDRLIAIEGVRISNSWLNLDVRDYQKFQTHVSNLNQQISGVDVDDSFSDRKKLIGTTVELTLERQPGSEFTVQVPRIGITSKADNAYCFMSDDALPRCRVTPDKQAYLTNWSRWYHHIFRNLTVLIVFPLMGVGGFLLSSDLAKEQRRGTLNFLRMSPRSGLNLLVGKLLGVPILLYLAIALTLPLHWFTGLSAGYGVGHLLGFDLALISQTLVFYIAALLLSLMTTHPALLALCPWLLTTVVTLFNGLILTHYWSSDCLVKSCSSFSRLTAPQAFDWTILFSPSIYVDYFGQYDSSIQVGADFITPLGAFQFGFASYTLLTIVHAWAWCGLLGYCLQRRFNNANSTLLKRTYSYPLTITLGVVAFGLTNLTISVYTFKLPIIALLGVLYYAALAVALAPNRQLQQEWARLRHAPSSRSSRPPLWKDLLVGDTSSPIVAIGLNLLLGTSLYAGWFLMYHSDILNHQTFRPPLSQSVLLFGGLALLSVLVSQILWLSKCQKTGFRFGLTTSLSCLAFPVLSLFRAIRLYREPYLQAGVFMTTLLEAMTSTLLLGLLGSVIAVLTYLHIRQLMWIGRSESQHLIESVRSPK